MATSLLKQAAQSAVTPIHIIVESSHIIRAEKKYAQRIDLDTLLMYLQRIWFKRPVESVQIVHGNFCSKNRDIRRRVWARAGYKIIEAPTRTSEKADGHRFIDIEYGFAEAIKNVPEKLGVVLIGFHNRKFVPIITELARTHDIGLAAYTTPSISGGSLSIPKEIDALVKYKLLLDYHHEQIQEMAV